MNPWSPQEDRLLRLMVEKDYSPSEIYTEFQSLGIDRSAEAIARHPATQGPPARQASPFSLEPPLEVEGDMLVLTDIHVPAHDATFINALIDLALDMGVTQVGICGDLLNLDAVSIFAGSELYDLDTELEYARHLMRVLSREFARVVYAPGNHEMRLSRKTDHALSIRQAIRLWTEGSNITFTPKHWFRLNSAGEVYQIEHPKNTSTHATLVPKKLCSKYLCHVIAGHGHLVGWAKDVSGKFWAIDSGVVADPQRLAYIDTTHSTRPAVNQGAVIVKEGMFLSITPETLPLYQALV